MPARAQRTLSLLLSRTGGPPHHGSVGYVNDRIAPVLLRAGWDVRAFRPPPHGATEEAMVPLGLAAWASAHDATGPVDVALHDGAGATIRAPGHDWARRHAVLYHGLAYGTGSWLAHPAVDLHLANSPYLARVLRSLLAFPDWHRRRLLDPRAFSIVTDVRMPVPCVSAPDGDPGLSQGSPVPEAVRAVLASGCVVGHALQPGKQDLQATLAIIFGLNDVAVRAGRPRVKLLIAETSLGPAQRIALDALLAGSGCTCADFFVPVPHLDQRALFAVLRACRFGLAFNRFPEPFGFYVLESVHNGCPVYTNGAGNNRWLLPADHGLVVQDATAMVAGDHGVDPSVYADVVARIDDDLGHPDRMRASCARGRAYIDAEWSGAAFERSLLAALARLDATPAVVVPFDTLRIERGPMLRALDPDSGRMRNDYGDDRLDAQAIQHVLTLEGRRCGDLDGAEMARIESHHRLFRRGILALGDGGT